MNTENRIPKIIHYCWFGGNPLPELAVRCIESWKRFCPDYEIRRWDESNFDLNCCRYVREAYDARKYAFVTDYVRLYALTGVGGIYMDTDVELVKPLDGFLHHQAFSGFEDETRIPTGIMACEKGFALFGYLLDHYDDARFLREDGTPDTTTNVETITAMCLERGFVPNNQFQILDGFALYPRDVFCPVDHQTKNLRTTENTVAIHWFAGSWWNPEQRFAGDLTARLSAVFPVRLAKRIARGAGVLKYRGLKAFLQKLREQRGKNKA